MKTNNSKCNKQFNFNEQLKKKRWKQTKSVLVTVSFMQMSLTVCTGQKFAVLEILEMLDKAIQTVVYDILLKYFQTCFFIYISYLSRKGKTYARYSVSP